MKKMPVLKQHSPIDKWRNIGRHISIGDIVYITKPIEKGYFRFQLTSKNFITDWDEKPENYKEIEHKCLDILESDEWSNKFIGFAYEGENGIVLFSIYDLTFQVYLDGVSVQKIAEAFGFAKHPILYHGSVKPKEQQSVGEFLSEIIAEKSNRRNSDDIVREVVVENVSRVYQYRRIIGKWSCQTHTEPRKIEKEKEPNPV